MADSGHDRRELPKQVCRAFHTLLDVLPCPGRAWAVGGGAARWLRGFDAVPQDIDVDAGAEHERALASALKRYEVSPPHHTDTDGWLSRIGHYEVCGTRVDICIDCEIRVGDSHYVGRFSRYRDRIVFFALGDGRLPVIPLEESLLVSLLMERWGKLREITASPAFERNFDAGYLRERAAESSIPDESLCRLLDLIP